MGRRQRRLGFYRGIRFWKLMETILLGLHWLMRFQREEGEPFVVRIKRGVITVASVTWEDKGDGTAYIRVSRFGGDTNTEWQKVVKEINVEMDELDVVVVDVRGNPGVYLQSSVYLADEFVQKGVVLWEE